jgi:hypothetical protein
MDHRDHYGLLDDHHHHHHHHRDRNYRDEMEEGGEEDHQNEEVQEEDLHLCRMDPEEVDPDLVLVDLNCDIM